MAKCENCGKETDASVNGHGFCVTQPCVDIVMKRALAPVVTAMRKAHADD